MQELNIVFENDEYLVVNKPAGLLTHGSDHIKEETLIDQILEKYPEIAGVGDELSHPGMMHRLDRLVSGLLVIAKTQASFENLKKQFKERTIQKFINYTLLRIRIKTGRTHQIRVHMAAYGHPIVGDPIYNTKMTRIKNKKLNLERIFLVATELMFKDLGGKEQNFKIDLPKELQDFMKVVK